jgi:hypothetical protein
VTGFMAEICQLNYNKNMTAYLKIALVVTFLCLDALTAFAQEITRGETVLTRPRTDYDAAGVPVGRFRLYPELTTDVVFDDNIFAAGDDAVLEVDGRIIDGVQEDTILLLAPELELRSDWSRHQLNVGGRVLSARYHDFSGQEFDDYELWADGELDFSTGRLRGGASHARLHELRTGVNEQRGVTPTLYTLDNVSAGYRYGPGRVFVDLDLQVDKLDFDSTLRFDEDTGFFETSNDDRDRTLTDGALRLGYKAGLNYSLFMEGRLYDIDYDLAEDRNGANRDSEGYDITGGAELNFTDVTFGQVFVGYRRFQYADPGFADQSSPIFGAAVDWNITRLTTLSILANQTIRGTIVTEDGVSSSGIDVTQLGFRVDHELMRNILLNLVVDYRKEDFFEITREDDVNRLEVGAVYLLNRYWELNGGYVYQKRDSNVDTVRVFRVNEVFIGLRAQI